MRAQDAPARLRRIGLVLELEDGSKVMVYADNLDHAQATVTTETPVGEAPGDPWGRRRVLGPPETSILIDGIGAYLVQYVDADVKVSAPGRQLEEIRRSIR